jgi:enterochelin esterase-like enzyme
VAQQPTGTLERHTVHGRALDGNLEGDSPDRPVVVYLPPSYATDTTRRYPVLYFLHGYTATAEAYVKSLAVPDSIDRAIAAGARDMIIVIPDAFTKYSGSMFSNSPTIGDWETFIARDLTEFIDTRYRTIAARDGRGLAGHSMGGYGTMRIGMKQPGAFAAMYAMSSCCLMNDPAARGAGPGPRGDNAAARGATRSPRWPDTLRAPHGEAESGNVTGVLRTYSAGLEAPPGLNRGRRFCRFDGVVNRVVSCWSLVGPALWFCLVFGCYWTTFGLQDVSRSNAIELRLGSR